jgi:predicted nucleic acid-binding protein
MRVFFDSSAFAKRYIDEKGTQEVLAMCEQATELAMSVIAIPELISAFCRLQRERKLSANQYRRLKAELTADIADAFICDTTPQVIGHSIQALERHPLRGMDAMHVGAALVSQSEVFVSADVKQCTAARALGLKVVAV